MNPKSAYIISNKEKFKQFVDDFYTTHKKPQCFGICRSEISRLAVSRGTKKVISVNFPFLNFNANFGSFAVFATAAKIGEYDNEIIFDITAEFVIRCLCMFYPFILEELNEYVSKFGDDEEVIGKFKILCDKFIKDPYSIKNGDVLFSNSIINNYIGKKHKNIQVIFELLRHISDIYEDYDKTSKFQFVGYIEDKKTQSLQVAYAKLHALSMGYTPLRSLNLDGIFSIMPNLAWSGNKPFELEYLRENELSLKIDGEFPSIDFIDKFPRYLMQVLPQADNIRILDSSKTRFGAFLGAGYTQMPGASYVNFNSGALGACMNEGRISSSVIVGEGTDIGGGASILGVLSGGNTMPISIGRNCLLGANSVTGISLGDGCIVDAGITVLYGSKIKITQNEARKIKEINPCFEILDSGLYKGGDLNNLHGIHFRVTSQDSNLIAFRSNRDIKLNEELH
ncbi:dapD [Helicobacter muridarum]|uniref:2,3,4,5-tetrahydropyridine-2-carboxylate N-succinyltransferase n=1 Tax=Helicobacter muridarum TaxID=216 RepID=A0A377PUM5_9HELI|nr:tetrahydrodipicolinate N-succinyltransferase N-terminal domain-containing protein [Helicobacter muridarum]TLE00745.1 dapD [Helicobacter muridarum]STQ86576.1 2,3,4,5-tetrahydropyridine-2-carboxylate N-succinyltransferase [Helicobacter muridarum]